MLFELSKNKSLKAILLKADLDNDTMTLVKSDASISEIKNSLIENISPENIISYRKYIAKAEEEFRQEEELDAERAEQMSESEQAAQNPEERERDDTSAEQAGDLSADLEDKPKTRTSKDKEYSKYNREVKKIEKYLKATKAMVEKVQGERDNEEPSGYSFEGQNAYANTFNSQAESNSYLNLMKLLEKEPTYLSSKYRKHYNAAGNFMINATSDKEGSGREINISELTQELINTYEAKLANSDMTLKQAFIRLHTNTWKRQPSAYKNIGRYKKDIQRAIARVRDMPIPDEDQEKAVKTLNRIRKNTNGLSNKLDYIVEVILKLQAIQRGGEEKIIARKVQKLVDAVKTLSETKVSNIQEDSELGQKLREINQDLIDIRNNPSEYIEEATRELADDIEVERVKLEKVNKEISRVLQYEPELQRLTELFYRMSRRSTRPEGRTLAEKRQIKELVERRDNQVKRYFQRVVRHLNTIDTKTKKMSSIIDTLDEREAEEFMDWISGVAGQRPTRTTQIAIEGIELIEGLDTFNNSDIRTLDRLGAEVETAYESIEQFTNSLEREMRREIIPDERTGEFRLVEGRR